MQESKPKRLGFIPRWRKMTWVLWIESAIFLIWIIGAAADRPSKDCEADQFLSKSDCVAASDAGTAIGVGLVIFFWFLVTVICFLIWFATRPKEKQVIIIREGESEPPRVQHEPPYIERNEGGS